MVAAAVEVVAFADGDDCCGCHRHVEIDFDFGSAVGNCNDFAVEPAAESAADHNAVWRDPIVLVHKSLSDY